MCGRRNQACSRVVLTAYFHLAAILSMKMPWRWLPHDFRKAAIQSTQKSGTQGPINPPSNRRR
jgi:hypothetical protein